LAAVDDNQDVDEEYEQDEEF